MGVDIYVFDILLDYKGIDLGDVLCLGRQELYVHTLPEGWRQASAILAHRFPEAKPEELVQSDGFAETFLRFLGARSVLSLDFSSFEGAELIHDLNEPISFELHDRLDFILDGGTLEHIYNIPMAIENIKLMLRQGGMYLSINGANNQLGHGLYQFSPELFWRAFGNDTGFVIESMALVPMELLNILPTRIPLEDPQGVRQEVGMTTEPTCLMVAARRRGTRTKMRNFYQGDFMAQWDAHAAASGGKV